MKRVPKILAIVFAVLMLASSLVACRTTPSVSAAPGAISTASASAAEPTKDTGKPSPMRYVTPGNNFPDQDKVLAAVNKKLQADGVNIEVAFTRIPWDGFLTKLNLMLSSGDKFELMHVMQDIENISTLVSMDAIIPIDDLLVKYPGLVSKFTQYQWSQAKMTGKTYAVPANWQEFSKVNGYLTYRSDVFKKISTDPFPTTFDGLFDISVKMQAAIKTETGKTPYMWLHQVSAPPSWLHRTYAEFPFYVDNSNSLTLVKQDGTAQSYFESDVFKKDATAYRKMYKAGLIDPDVLNAVSQKKYDEMKIGVELPSNTFSYDDEISLKENIPTAELDIAYLSPEKPFMQYTSIQNLNAVSATSANPEAGLKFLNWLYEKKDNHDLFIYGVEGTDYTASAPNRIKSTLGTDKSALYAFDSWMIGYLPYMRWDERAAQKSIDFKTLAAPADKVALSPQVGFLFDATSLKGELPNINAEVIASFYPIKFGLVDYDTAYPEAIKKLKAAGIDKYIAEFQKQLTAFLASRK